MKNRGFTLLEVLIYIALFSVLIGGAIVAGYNLLESGNRNETAVAIQEEGNFLNRKINWALTGATSVTASSPTTLTVVRSDLGTLVFTASAGSLTLTRGSATPTTLNSAAFSIDNLAFAVTPAQGGLPASVVVNFSIQGRPFTFGRYLRQ